MDENTLYVIATIISVLFVAYMSIKPSESTRRFFREWKEKVGGFLVFVGVAWFAVDLVQFLCSLI